MNFVKETFKDDSFTAFSFTFKDDSFTAFGKLGDYEPVQLHCRTRGEHV